MNACEIQTVISDFCKMPYKSILISGPWGIGKSYAVSKALPDNSYVISLFGIKKTEEVYHNLFFEICAHSNSKVVSVASKGIDGALTVLGNFSAVAKVADDLKNTITSMFSEKDVLYLGLKKLDNQHIIVFDDLERLSEEIDLSEIFGIIEELKKLDNIKIIIVANLDELESTHKKVFKSYSEKVIDRIYRITEPSLDIDWEVMGINSEFAKKFTSYHKVKNLRTLQKAQNFYEDVRINGGVENPEFLVSVQQLCYGVVVENIDELYLEEARDKETKSMNTMELTLASVRALLQSRISRYYLDGAWCSSTLLNMIEKYYSESGVLDKEQYQAEYKMFLNSGEVRNYYKSEDEIIEVLSHWKEWFKSARNVRELYGYAEEAVVWTEVLENPIEDILLEFRSELSNMLWELVLENGVGALSVDDYSYYTEKTILKDTARKVVLEVRNRIIHKYLDDLKNSMDGPRAFELSYQLRQCYQNTYYCEIVKEHCWDLLRDESFPIVGMTEEKYHTCYNVLYILRSADKERYDEYVENLLTRCDRMAAHRIKNINIAIDEK